MELQPKHRDQVPALDRKADSGDKPNPGGRAKIEGSSREGTVRKEALRDKAVREEALSGETMREESGSKDRYVILVLVLAGVLMTILDGSAVSIALPTITAYFHVSLGESQWIMTSYLLTLTSLLMVFGKVAERTGRARMFFFGIVFFTLSSLACGLANSLGMLILFRVTQSAGAAMMFSIGAALVFQAFPRGEQGRAMGYVGSTVAIGSIIGPTLGGLVTDNLGWNYIFLINVPIGIAQLLLSLRYLRIEESRSRSLRLDWSGTIALMAFLVSLMAFLGELSSSFSLRPSALALGLIAAGSLSVFLINESRQKEPLLDMSIFKYRGFVLAVSSLMVYYVSNLMISVLGPFYFEGAGGYAASQVGLIFLIVPAIMVVGSPASGWIYDRYQCRYIAAAGLSVMAASMILMGYMAAREGADPRLLLLTFVPMGVGSALFQGPNNTEIMRALPRSKVNIASSFTSTIRNLGMTLGVSLSGVIVSVQLGHAGFYGTITEASPGLVSSSTSNGMILAGMICVLGALASALKAREGDADVC
jgi:EmrB/QacA subfamily drug resistance transporter